MNVGGNTNDYDFSKIKIHIKAYFDGHQLTVKQSEKFLSYNTPKFR